MPSIANPTHPVVGAISEPPPLSAQSRVNPRSASRLGLDLAVSVASGTPALGPFPVEATRPALVYLAEDTLYRVRDRLAHLCRHSGLHLSPLNLQVINIELAHCLWPRTMLRRTAGPFLFETTPVLTLDSNRQRIARAFTPGQGSYSVPMLELLHSTKQPSMYSIPIAARVPFRSVLRQDDTQLLTT